MCPYCSETDPGPSLTTSSSKAESGSQVQLLSLIWGILEHLTRLHVRNINFGSHSTFSFWLTEL